MAKEKESGYVDGLYIIHFSFNINLRAIYKRTDLCGFISALQSNAIASMAVLFKIPLPLKKTWVLWICLSSAVDAIPGLTDTG